MPWFRKANATHARTRLAPLGTYAIVYGRVYDPPSRLWAPRRLAGDLGVWRPVGPYVPVPVVAPRGYPGEGYLRMQPGIDKPHPSGLPSTFRLTSETEATTTRGR